MQFTEKELSNLKYFLLNGKWNLSVQESVELVTLTQKVEKLLLPETTGKEVETKE